MDKKDILDFTKAILPSIEKLIADDGDRCHGNAEKVIANSENGRIKFNEITEQLITREDNPEILLKYLDRMAQYNKEADERQAETLKQCYAQDSERRRVILWGATMVVANVALPLITKNTNIRIPMRIPA